MEIHMITRSPYIFIASMDVDSEHEQLFNEVYDEEHVPSLSAVAGVLEVGRFARVDLTMAIGGKLVRVEGTQPKYHAVYGIESPEILTSTAWSNAVEAGRWPRAVRPYTVNRQHFLIQRIER
jgi:hypothetical protein